MNTIEKIKRIIAEITQVDYADIKENAILQEEYSLSSIEVIQMILKIEEEFKIEFTEKELDPENVKNITSINKIVNLLIKNKENRI